MNKSIRMRLFFSWMVFLIFAVSSAAAQNADSTAEKREDIKRLMVLTGAGNIGMQVMNQLTESFKKSLPQVPNGFWDDYMAEVDASSLVQLCVPIYERHLSHSDIKELIRFYESPAGQRLIKVLPVIMQESMEAGQRWGQEIGQKAVQKLREKGYQ
ncbi:MAG TPA: DUF2059 domain-containing protein [bacterium]